MVTPISEHWIGLHISLGGSAGRIWPRSGKKPSQTGVWLGFFPVLGQILRLRSVEKHIMLHLSRKQAVMTRQDPEKVTRKII